MVTWSKGGPVRTAITVSDVEGYTRRDDDGQRDLQAWMTDIEARAALKAGLDRHRALVQGTGDGNHTTWPPSVGEFDLITHYLRELRCELDRVNASLSERGRIRMRVSVCSGLVEAGPQGAVGQTAIRASLLVNSDQLRAALRDAPSRNLAVIIEDKLFEDVVMAHRDRLRPEDYERVVIRDKYGRDHVAHVTVPGGEPSGTGPVAARSDPARSDPAAAREGTVAVAPGDDEPAAAETGRFAPARRPGEQGGIYIGRVEGTSIAGTSISIDRLDIGQDGA